MYVETRDGDSGVAELLGMLCLERCNHDAQVVPASRVAEGGRWRFTFFAPGLHAPSPLHAPAIASLAHGQTVDHIRLPAPHLVLPFDVVADNGRD